MHAPPQKVPAAEPQRADATRTPAPGSAPSELQVAIAGRTKGRVQPKLRVGEPNDAHEQEADRVADEVMRMPAAAPTAAPPPADGAIVRRRAVEPGVVEDKTHEEDEELVRRQTAPPWPSAERSQQGAEGSRDSVPAVSALVERQLSSAHEGAPLPSSTRTFFESRFGCDFSRVRVHTGSLAAESADSIDALAYTFGDQIVFSSGQFAPDTTGGQRLLAHELTHVVQQRTVDLASGLAVPVRQRGTAGIVARAAAPVAAAPVPAPSASEAAVPSREPVDTRNYDRLADIIFKAIDGWGTDEEAVYGALEELNRMPAAIEKLTAVYKARHPGHDLVADIRDDFSGSELEFALQLINLGDPNSAQRIEATADTSEGGLARAAKRLNDAFEVFLGTDEEAIFAVLLPFKRDQTALGSLRSVYQRNFHESLKERLFDELSGLELEHALFLFLTPQEAYEYYVLQASKDLSGGVEGGRSVGDQTIGSSKARYDRARWEPGNPSNPQGTPEVAALKLKSDIRPSDAIQAMYDSMSQAAPFAYAFGSWRADCAEWVQVHHLYAMLKTLGPYRFDQRFGGKEFWFKPQRSTGVKARALFFREYANERMKPAKLKEGQPEITPHDSQPIVDASQQEADPEQLLMSAPIGSRVAWFNRAIRHSSECGIVVTPEGQGFGVENTIKLGPDLYGAHGFGLKVNMTRRQIAERSLAYGKDPRLSEEENFQRTVYIGEIEFYSTVAEEPWQ
jgi:hypothetical protein